MNVVSLAAFALVLVVVGCSDLGTPLEPTPLGQVSATAIDFGTVAVGQSTTRTVVVSNVGTGKLVATPSVAWTEFTVESGGGTFTLRPGESRTITVRFTPSGVGVFNCALEFGSQPEAVTLAGSGANQNPGARGLLMPDTLSFGSLHVGTTATASFDLYSLGTTPLIVDVQSPCSDYQITQGGGPALLQPGDKITVTIVFSPTVPGPQSCVISVGPGIPEVGVSGSAFSVSFANDVEPILNDNCSFCHSFGDQFEDYPELLQFNRVIPYDPDNSVIWNRIANTGRFGSLMPQGGPKLPQAQIDTIRQWILEGALDN